MPGMSKQYFLVTFCSQVNPRRKRAHRHTQRHTHTHTDKHRDTSEDTSVSFRVRVLPDTAAPRTTY